MNYSAALTVLVALAGCDSKEDTATGDTDDAAGTQGSPSLEIVGSWLDDFGTAHDIDESAWIQQFGSYDPLVFHVIIWDNSGGWLVAQNDADAAYSAGLYSRFDWTWDADRLYVCQAVFDAATEADAQDAPQSDGGDLQGAGCGGFPWSALALANR